MTSKCVFMEIPLTYQSDGKKLRETRYCTICCTAAPAGVLDGSLPPPQQSLLWRQRTPAAWPWRLQCTPALTMHSVQMYKYGTVQQTLQTKTQIQLQTLPFTRTFLGFVVCFGAQKAFAFTILYSWYILVNALSAEPYASNRGDQMLYSHVWAMLLAILDPWAENLINVVFILDTKSLI